MSDHANFNFAEIIEIVAIFAGLVTVIAFTAKREKIGWFGVLPFLYVTVTFCSWVMWQDVNKKFCDLLTGLIALNFAVGIMLVSAIMQIRSKK